MSPFVFGNSIGSLSDKGKQVRQLNIAYIGELDADFTTYYALVRYLYKYLEDKESNVKISFFGINSDIDSLVNGAEVVEIEPLEYSSVREYGLKKDIDIIYDPNRLLECEQTKEYNVEFGYEQKIEGLEEVTDSFLAGNGIAWDINDPIWNNDWLNIYFRRPGVSSTAYEYMNTFRGDGKVEPPEKEKVRNIVNKLAQIEYCKALLKHSILLKRRERRYEQSHYLVAFEANYHLGAYYFLIAGLLDTLARYINFKYEMGLTHHSELALEKRVFKKSIKEKNEDIANVLTGGEFNKWIRWMKQRRNYIAHEAAISLTSIVNEPKVRMSDEELERIVAGQLDWDYVENVMRMPKEQVEAQKQLVAQLIRMNELESELEDAMLLRDPRADKIFLPLNSIDLDFKHVKELTEKLITIFRST